MNNDPRDGERRTIRGTEWFRFAPDGRIFYGERFTGQIRILSANGSSDTLFFTVPDASDVELLLQLCDAFAGLLAVLLGSGGVHEP